MNNLGKILPQALELEEAVVDFKKETKSWKLKLKSQELKNLLKFQLIT